MGRQKLGALIREIDFSKVKGDPEPVSTKVTDLEYESRNDRTFEELKDAFAAFEEKVCIKEFPEFQSYGYWVADATLLSLTRMISEFVDEHGEKTKLAAEVLLHTAMALIRAGPNSAHCEILTRLHEATPSIEEYVQGLKKKDLLPILETLKFTFKYTPNKNCDEKLYGEWVRGAVLSVVYWLSEEQRLKMVHKEYLEVYIHHQAQMAEMSKTLSSEVNEMVRDMVVNFEDSNPYLGFKDTALIKNHITVMKDLACCEGYVKGRPIEKTVERTLTCIVDAMLRDKNVFKEVFDHLMTTIVEISYSPVARKQGEHVFAVFKYLFNEMKDNVTTSSAIVKSCVNMILGVTAHGGKSRFVEKIADKAMKDVLCIAPELSSEDVKLILNMITVFLQSGRKRLVVRAKEALENMKDTGVLDWKIHIEEAKKFLEVVGEIPKSKLQNDKFSEVQDTVAVYCAFSKVLLIQLKRGKVLPQLQPTILSFFINCLSVATPLKSEIADLVSNGGLLNISPKDKNSKMMVLQKLESLLKNKKLPWSHPDLIAAAFNMLQTVIESYDGNGNDVSPEENELFVSIFKIAGQGNDVSEQFYEEDEQTLSIYGNIYQHILMQYVNLHQQTSTLECLTPVIQDILKWAKLSLKEKKPYISNGLFTILNFIGTSAPTSMQDSLPKVLDLMLTSDRAAELFSLVQQLYPNNPKALHSKLQAMFDRLDNLKEQQRAIYINIFHTVAQSHPEVFTKGMITKLFAVYKRASQGEKSLILLIIKFISEKKPAMLAEFLSQLCDDKMFKPDSMNLRSGIIACIGSINATLGQQAVDYLMKFADHADPAVSQTVMVTASNIVRDHIQYMQKYKAKLEKLEKTSTIPQVRDIAHEMILKLEGKSVENIADDLQQQQEDIADLDVKVDSTMGTVVTIGGKVVEHEKEIGELGEGLVKVEVRVDDVEDDLGDTKIKVEEIDNKTMSNAPKWSRDLTKLMNPTAKNDWRLLASRLGYHNDDIRGWATQHDPCMALLSEWYATHKTSEASFGVLTALTEMNRMDGVVIVENAMKAAEGVVDDEEFEYPSPPPVFISYQWGFQNEVKLLKQHLNMAGYECWLDVGQMGGGDKLFAKIDNGIRGAKIVICCVTEKYAKSPNCNREVNLSVNLNKPIIPLLMEKMDWPPKGSMGPIFSEYLFIRFFQRSGEETNKKDQRYWPIPKFQELLMQLNFFVVPDQKLVKKEYAKWWSPMVEEIVIDKEKGRKQANSQKAQKDYSQVLKDGDSPVVFLSYQWGKQPQIKALYKRLTSLGYTVWMDIYQMGGGDSLYDKIDRGMRGCKAVVSCVTQKYSLSANCRREISLADALKKPIIPLLLEQMKWPPDGPMSMVFTELLFINFYRDEKDQMMWKGDKFDELLGKLHQFVPQTNTNSNNQSKEKTPAVTSNSTKTAQNGNVKATASNKEQLIEKKDTKDKTNKNKVMTAEGVNTTASNKEPTSKTQENIMEKKDGLDKTDKNKLMTAADNNKVARKDSGKISAGNPANILAKTTSTKANDENEKTKLMSVSEPDSQSVKKTNANKQESNESGTVAKGVVTSDTSGQENNYNQKQRNDDSKQGTSKSCNIL